MACDLSDSHPECAMVLYADSITRMAPLTEAERQHWRQNLAITPQLAGKSSNDKQ